VRQISWALLGLPVLLVSSLHAGVLVNGGFETGDFTGWAVSGSAVVCNGATDIFCGVPYDGSFSVSLNAGDAAPDAVLDQAFATQPGVQYQVSFAYGIVDYAGGQSQQLQMEIVSALGGLHDLQNQTVTSPPSVNPGSAFNGAVNYQLFTFLFTADDSSATLQFTDAGTNPTVSVDGKLDAASVTQAPEPDSFVLLALGLGFACAGRLKRFARAN
jgi:hypothetical protein